MTIWARRLMVAGLVAVMTLSAGTAQAAPNAPQGGQRPGANVPSALVSTTAFCNPRPRVTVQSEPALLPVASTVIGLTGKDALLVTVTTTGAGMGVRALRFTATTNAVVTVLDANAHVAPYEVTFPAGNEPSRISFALWRQDASQASVARLLVVDACGEWTTFVGRGAGPR